MWHGVSCGSKYVSAVTRNAWVYIRDHGRQIRLDDKCKREGDKSACGASGKSNSGADIGVIGG